MFDQFREKFQAVQQDLSDGFKSLGVKAQNVSKTKRNSETFTSKHDNLPNLRDGLHISAGADLLDSFQGHWTSIHQDIEECANKATETDALIQKIALAQEKQFAEWRGIKRQLQEIPNLLKDIQNITAKIGKLTADFEEVEAALIELEDVTEEEEHQKNENIQRKELENYQKQKLHEEELLKVRLQDEFDEKLQVKQKEENAKMRERQQAFQEFFADDLRHFKEFGKMQRPMEVTVQETHLEDFEIDWDEHDQQALNDFLGPSEDQGPSEVRPSEDQGPSEVNVGSTVVDNESSEKENSEKRNGNEAEKKEDLADTSDGKEAAPCNKMEQLKDIADTSNEKEDAPCNKMEELKVEAGELQEEEIPCNKMEEPSSSENPSRMSKESLQ